MKREPSRRFKRIAASFAVPGALICLLGFALQPPDIPALYEEAAVLDELSVRWQHGDVIALVRHLERCDRSDAPCLAGDDNGITARSVRDGEALGADFSALGLDHTDVFNSPLPRTAQTAQVLFGETADRAWLRACKTSLKEHALAHKKPGRNLILVTHSGCLEGFQDAMGFDEETPEYGESIFVRADQLTGKLELLGYLEPQDWDKTFDN